ncbi:MAG TPA: hypothetical protein VI814_00915 [Candidatus Limnocylindria bacterium]
MLGIDERRRETRKIDGHIAIAGIGIDGERTRMESALAEVARYVVVGVHAREAKPRAIALVTETTGLDEHVDLRHAEHVATAGRIAAEHREPELRDRADDGEGSRAGGEVGHERSGCRPRDHLHALLRRLRRCAREGLRCVRRIRGYLVGSLGLRGLRGRGDKGILRDGRADHHDIRDEERRDQAAAVLH